MASPAGTRRPRRLCSNAQWLLSARAADYLLAMSVASASLPVIGRRLEPLGAATAMGLWGYRYLPGFMAAAGARFDAGNPELRQRDREMTSGALVAALREIIPGFEVPADWPGPQRTPPWWHASEQRRHVYCTSVPYGPHRSQLLDVWRREDPPTQAAPVLIFVPGGGWIHGSRRLQGYALMSHLAAMGWVCLSIDYRVAPHHRWPAHITDVKTAISWARANVDRFGGDRDFVAIAGSSAGGHLAALAGLSAHDPELQHGLPEHCDTSVDAVVSLYGRYDWEDRSTPERAQFMDFLEQVVVRRRASRHPDIFRQASPVARVHPDAPPFLVVHGSADWIIPVDQARAFVARLRSVSASAVGYIELPGAGHAFDMIDGARTAATVAAVGVFLNHIHDVKAIPGTRTAI